MAGQSNVTEDNVYTFGAQVNKFDLNETQNLEKENAISHFTTLSPTEGILTFKLLETDVLNNYNHIKREWTKEEFSQRDKLNILNPQQSVSNFRSSLIDLSTININKEDYIRNYTNFSKLKIYPILQDLELGNNAITFNILGYINFDCRTICSIK